MTCGKGYLFVAGNVEEYNTRLNQTLYSWVAEFDECGVFFVRYAVVTLTFVTSHSCLSFFMFRLVHWTAFNRGDAKIITVVIRPLKCTTMNFRKIY